MQVVFRLTADDIHDDVAFLRAVSRIVEPARGIPVVLSDPADDPVVYTAAAAGADILCVKDRDFYDPNVLEFCASQDIRVMDDVALLELLGRTGS